jgi:hypothetical protein
MAVSIIKDYKKNDAGYYIGKDGELSIEAENYSEHVLPTYAPYSLPHRWILCSDTLDYGGKGYLQVLPDEWPEGADW